MWLRVADGSGWAPDRDLVTFQPLCAPAEIYKSSGLRLRGDKPGDDVFRHPKVQTLLANARKRVWEVLDAQPGPPEDRWIICIRTYGRSGIGLGDVPEIKRGILHLTLANLTKALGPKLARERCLIFVSHEDRQVWRGRYEKALSGTFWADRVVLGVKGADLQVRFIEEAAPLGAHVVVVDDNVIRFMVESGGPVESGVRNRVLEVGNDDGTRKWPELAALITRAGQEVDKVGAKLWGICPTHNPLYTHNFGEISRRRIGRAAANFAYSTNLGLVYGAFFGFRAAHDPSRYTRYGQVRDDVERSLRYWHEDKVVLRFQRYCVLKSQKPGIFIKGKGGISAGSSAARHAAESERAIRSMLTEFAWPYARLPRREETCKVMYGICWKASASRGAHRSSGGELNDVDELPEDVPQAAAAGKASVASQHRSVKSKRKFTPERHKCTATTAKRTRHN